MPGLTHWNHPGFFAYFAITASGPGVLAEMLVGRPQPAGDALAHVAGRDRARGGRARLAARADRRCRRRSRASSTTRRRSRRCTRSRRRARRPCPACASAGSPAPARPRSRVYCSEHAHSSVDKAVITLGLGHEALRRIPVDERFAMRPTRCAPRSPRIARPDGCRSPSSRRSARRRRRASIRSRRSRTICSARGVWLHVDAAYAGVTAMLPEYRTCSPGAERADSLVVNPHKWLFTPFDLSAFYCRRMDVLRRAFSLVPEYLRTTESGAGEEPDGHRHPARPPVPRVEAVDGAALLRRRGHPRAARRTLRLARLFASWVDADPRFERVARCRSASCASAAHRRAYRTKPALDRAEPAAARCGERDRRGVPVAHQAPARTSCCGSRSAISARPRRTCGARGTCCETTRPASAELAGWPHARPDRPTLHLNPHSFGNAASRSPRPGHDALQPLTRWVAVSATTEGFRCDSSVCSSLSCSARRWRFPRRRGRTGFSRRIIGANLHPGGDALDFDTESGTVNFGGSLGFMGAGIFGFEVDFGYAPELLRKRRSHDARRERHERSWAT